MSLFCQQVLVTIDTHQAHLTTIRRPGSSNHTLILMQELWHKLIDGKLKVSKSTWKRAKREVKRGSISYYHEELTLPLALTLQLKELGAIHLSDHNSQHAVCSPAMLRELLIKCGVTLAHAKHVYNSIKQACQPLQQGQPTTQLETTALASPPLQQQAPAIAPGMSLALRQAVQAAEFPHHSRFQVLPGDLPPYPEEVMDQLGSTQFGLGTTINSSPATTNLKQQIADMEQHLTRPINPFRHGKHMQANTMHDYIKTIFLFMGVVHHVLGRPLQQLSLWDCACPAYLAMFLCIQLERGILQGSMAMAGYRLKGILSYLEFNSMPGSEKQQLSTIATWFNNLRGQVVDRAARPNKVNLQEMPPLEQVIYKQEHLMQREIAKFKAFFKDPAKYMRDLGNPRGISMQQVQDTLLWGLHDVTLFGFMFGHLPPCRLLAITTCKHPKYAKTPCTDCSQVGCLGNRLVEMASSSSSSTSARRFSLQLVHHKVANSSTANLEQQHEPSSSKRPRCSSNSISALPTILQVPSSLHEAVELWVDRGWPLLKEFSLVRGRQDSSTRQLLFLNPITERAFIDCEYSPWFKGMLIKSGFKEQEAFCPQTARHLWVTTMKVQAAAGIKVPNMAGQAHIMGHKPSQWDAPIYNLLQKQVESKLAADAMPAWRQQVLSSFEKEQQQQEQPGTMLAAHTLEQLLHSLNTFLQQQQQQQPTQPQPQPAKSSESFHSCIDSFYSCEDDGDSDGGGVGAACTKDCATSS